MQGFYLWYINLETPKISIMGRMTNFSFKIIFRSVLFLFLLRIITAVEIEIRILEYWSKGSFSLI